MKTKPTIVILVPAPHKNRLQKEARAFEDTHESAAAVEAALKTKGYFCRILAVGSVEKWVREVKPLRDAIFFNLCEDLRGAGEGEGHLAALLEFCALPYTGSPPESLLACLDKNRTKQILRAHGLPTPSGWLLTQTRLNGEKFSFPAIAKPARADGSIGITEESVVQNKTELVNRLAAMKNYFPVLVEEFVAGREINAAILGDRVLPLSEILFPDEPDPLKQICSYDAKWESDSAAYRNSPAVCPAKLGKKTENELKRLAREACAALRVRDYARVDFRLAADGRPFILEVNPNPCLTPDAGFAWSAAAAGINYADLVDKIVLFAVARKQALQKK